MKYFVLLLGVPVLLGGAAAAAKDASSTTTPLMRKISDSIIYRDERFYASFPSIVARPDGTLLCAFRRAPDRRYLWGSPSNSHTDANSYLMLSESHDGGVSWSQEPRLLFAHPLGGSQDPCMVQLHDGSIVCTSYGWSLLPPERLKESPLMLQHPPFGFLGGYVLRSEDGGSSWQGPMIPPSVPGNMTTNVLGTSTPAYNRGAPLETKDGRLLWAVVGHETLTPRHASVHLLESRDRGSSWKYLCPIAFDKKVSFNETSLVETQGGDIVAFMRTDDFAGKAAVARSRDGGKSFEPWQDGGFFGHPFHGANLPDGRILLVYGYRQKPFGVRARLLNANADNFQSAEEIVLRDDGGNVDVGYPWAAVLPGGKAIVVYYINIADGTRHIAATTLEIK